MRLLALPVLAILAAAPAAGQSVGMIGPSFKPTSVRAENFDVVFELEVNALPSIPVLWNQPLEARWDGVICNVGKANQGAVKADPTARYGYLDVNACTMFANFHTLDLTTVEADKQWTAKIYLRARK
jgi:hypothetical protein